MPEVTINSAEVVFPPICPACQMPATKLVPVEKEVDFLVAQQRTQLSIPYCDRHAEVLAQSARRLRRVSVALILGSVLLCALYSYWIILALPSFKVIPGSSFLAWVISTVVVMGGLAILFGTAGAALIMPIVRSLIPRIFDTAEAKQIQSSIQVQSFDMPPVLMGKSKLKRITFTVIDPIYARQFHELNPGSILND